MTQLKNRLQALSMLDRAFTSVSDEDLAKMVEALPEDHRSALDEVVDGPEGGFTDPDARITAMRAYTARGRMNGGLEQVCTVLTDPCLAECIEKLDKNSDDPTEEQLKEVTPELVEKYGLPTVRMMMAVAVTGEATASVMLTHLLKHDETFALPPVEHTETEVRPAPHADDETKARRKAAKERKQADARARRE